MSQHQHQQDRQPPAAAPGPVCPACQRVITVPRGLSQFRCRWCGSLLRADTSRRRTPATGTRQPGNGNGKRP